MVVWTLQDQVVFVHLPEAPSSLLVYFHGSAEEADKVWSLLSEPKPMMVTIPCRDWNQDYSPWPAENVWKKSPPFAGGADKWVSFWIEDLLPLVEERLPVKVRCRATKGYSLAGLFSVFTVLQCSLFDAVASVSGSLWYDDFAEYVRNHIPHKRPSIGYFSLGMREKNAKNERMSHVEEKTGEVFDCLRGSSDDWEFRLVDGGHFDNPEKRLADAVMFIVEHFEKKK